MKIYIEEHKGIPVVQNGAAQIYGNPVAQRTIDSADAATMVFALQSNTNFIRIVPSGATNVLWNFSTNAAKGQVNITAANQRVALGNQDNAFGIDKTIQATEPVYFNATLET